MKLRHSHQGGRIKLLITPADFSIKMKELAVVFLVSTLLVISEERTPRQLLYSPLLTGTRQNSHIYQIGQNPQITPYYSFWLNAAQQPLRRVDNSHYPMQQLQFLPLNSQFSHAHVQQQQQPYIPHSPLALPPGWNHWHYRQKQNALLHPQIQVQDQGHHLQTSNYFQSLQHLPLVQHQHNLNNWQTIGQLQHQPVHQQNWQTGNEIQHHHQNDFHPQQPESVTHHTQEIFEDKRAIHDDDDSEVVEADAGGSNDIQNDHHWPSHTAKELPPRDFSDYNFDFSNLSSKPLLPSKPKLTSLNKFGFDSQSQPHHLGFQRGHIESNFEKDEEDKGNSLSYVNHVDSKDSLSPSVIKGGSVAKTNVTRVSEIRGGLHSEWEDLTNNGNVGVGGFNRGAVESRASAPSPLSWRERQSITYQTRQESYRVVCYFANWGWFRDENAGRFEPEFIDPKLCTHVIYAYATYDKNTMGIKPSEPSVDEDNKFFERVVNLKKENPNLKVLLAVGGWSDSYDSKYSSLANSENNRRKFAREAVTYLQKRGFDGISIDWHYPVCWQSDCQKGPKSDKSAFVHLLQELRLALAPERLLVVASLSGYKEVIDAAYDVPKISEYLDFMNIMTFDYHGSWESRTGHLSPLYAGPPAEDLKRTYNSDFTMEYYVSKGADASKLILGIPMYGQTFTLENEYDSSLGSLATGPGQPGVFTKQEGMLAYYEICRNIREDGWNVRKSSTGSHGPYAFKGKEWVGYDDVEFVKRKALYVKTKSFGGAFVFTLDLDDFTNVCCGGDYPLLRTLADVLLGIPFNFRKQGCSTPSPQPPSGSPAIIRPIPIRPNTTEHYPSEVVTQAPEPNPIEQSEHCEYTSRPHASDCNAYYLCDGGHEVLQMCPVGLHWNPSANTCDWPAHAGCSLYEATEAPSPEPPPPPTKPPTWKPPPKPSTTLAPEPAVSPSTSCFTEGQYSQATNCDQYFLCSNGIAKLQSCGPGLHWNNEKKLCDWPSEARCQFRHDGASPADESCQEGSFAPSAEDCDVYYVCVHGQNMKFRCQGGLHWNSQLNVCDWPNNAGCQVGQGVPPPEAQRSTTTARPTTPAWTWTTPNRPSSTMIPPVPSYEPVAPPAPPSVLPPAPPQRPVTVSPPAPPPSPTAKPELSGDYKIVCYFTNWAWYRPGTGKYKPDDINADLCTHIVYGFAVLDSEQLLIKPHDSWADIDNKFYEQVTALKRKGKKVTVAIGGWNDSAGDKYSRLVNNAAARAKFIKHVVQFIKANNFDGLDLDWEYPKCWQVECNKGPESDKPNFAAFVKELSEAFRPYNFLLSAAVSPSKTVIDAGYDVPTIASYMDWIAVMAYDYHGQWDKKTGHVAPLYFHEEDDVYFFNANYSVNYWINNGADRRKIIMGMPLYGQSFTLANPAEHGLNAPTVGGGTAGEYTRAAGFLANYEICHNIQKDGWTVVKDETGAMGPYAYKGNQWVSYDDVDIIRKKSELIRKLGLGGGMVWALDLDDFRNTCGQGSYPLLSTIKSVLGRPKGIADESVPEPSVPSIPVQPTPVHQDKPMKPPVVVVEDDFDTVVVATPAPRPPLKNEEIEHCTEPFKRHEKDCSKYYQCVFGRYLEQSCPPGTVWNKDRCDWPGNTDCGDASNNVEPPKPPAIIRSTTTTTMRPPPQPVQHTEEEQTTARWPSPTTAQYIPPDVSFPVTSYRPPRRTTTPTPTKDPEWCRLNWCPTPKPIPPNKHTPVNMPPSDYKVVCYFTNWAWYRQGNGKYKPEDINFNLCTHIIYGFAVLNPSTLVIRPHDDWADIDNQFYKQVTQLREKGVIVMLALGGWNDSLGDKYSRLVNNAEARRKFIDHAITFIEQWDFDGLDLDWEYPKCWQVDCEKGPESDKPAFATFVREIKEAFEPRGLLLSSAVSPNNKVIDQGYDVPTVSRYLDWIAVMTYDYHGQFDGKTGHNSPMYAHPEDENQFFNTNYTINYWIQNGADRKKIVMGMPMYGQSFTLVNSSNTGLNSKSSGGAEAGEFTRSKGFLAYYEICNYVQKNGWTMVQDKLGTMGPYAYKGDQWVSFDDIDQIRRKSEYVKSMRLGGGMIWALDLDDFRGVCGCEEHPLLKTINRVLRNYPEPDPKCRF